MSLIPPEGVPSPSPSATSGVAVAHVAGGGAAGVVGAAVVAVCNHFGWHVSDVDAVLVGAAAVSTGVGLGHVIGKVGLFGAFKQLLHGSKA